MKKIKKISILLLLLGLFSNVACEVEGGRRSTSTSSSSLVVSSSSVSSMMPSNSSTSTSSSSSSSISTGLPLASQEFIDMVEGIVVDENAGEAISNAFLFFDNLEAWDYPEVLEAYNRLCAIEEEYNTLISKLEKINLYLEKVVALPEEITLEDEYLINRAEDSYAKLDEDLKTEPTVVEAYNKMVAARESYDILYNAAMAKKDEEDVAAFLGFVNSLPAVENLTYTHYFTIQEAIDSYDLLSENARKYEGVEEAYQKLHEAQSLINVLNGDGLFDINVVHGGTSWEAILNIKAKDDAQKITGSRKVHELRVYEDGVQMLGAHMLAWGSIPYSYSFTKSDGNHTFAFTFSDYYNASSLYLISFIVETAAKEAYAVSYYYVVDGSFTCGGYSEIELYKNQLVHRVESFYESDYSEENWNKIQSLVEEGLAAIDIATTPEHARILVNQYYFEMASVEKRFGEITGMSVIEASSVPSSMGTIVDDSPTTSWQAASTVNEYVIIDLGDTYSIEGLRIMWEVANAKNYDVKVSSTNEDWASVSAVYQFRNGESGNRTDEIRFESVECRYIRLELRTGSTQWGFRIFELDVYSTDVVQQTPPSTDQVQ